MANTSALLEKELTCAPSAAFSCAHLLCDSQHRGTRARIGGEFFLARADLAADALHARLCGIGNDRKPGVHRVGVRLRLDELLDDAVFERVEADDREPAADREQLERGGERAAQ